VAPLRVGHRAGRDVSKPRSPETPKCPLENEHPLSPQGSAESWRSVVRRASAGPVERFFYLGLGIGGSMSVAMQCPSCA